jgi:hypothetical protein
MFRDSSKIEGFPLILEGTIRKINKLICNGVESLSDCLAF